MGKTYIDTVKYLVKANFEVDGIIEKPDIVGAVFGQTEGLLGDELDLRELQKNGRIGRIEVETQVRGGKTVGQIFVPSSLDMVETSILAASLEVVDRVGPCEARISVNRIEDSRNLKRKQVLDRAKNLLKTMVATEIPESKELSELVRDAVKISDAVTIGDDHLVAGPGIQATDSILVVEGRADVLNLLKNGIKNVVAVGGANVGKTIAELCREKEATVFLDGDRGGDIILRELVNATDVDFVARAPPGREVEELTRKEIIMALRKRVPIEQVEGYAGEKRAEKGRGSPAAFEEALGAPSQAPREAPAPAPQPFREQMRPQRERFGRDRERGERRVVVRQESSFVPSAPEPVPQPAAEPEAPADPAKVGFLKNSLKELEGSLKARIVAEDNSVQTEVPIRDIMTALDGVEKAFAIVLDGIVTQRLVDAAEQKGVQYVAGIRAGTITRKAPTTRIVLAA
ncbi:MAG: DNA primase DnaG [Candidatus Micrarchaeota archaeon]